MPNTFTLIASSTVGAGGAANITFSSIAGTYTDLCLKVSLRDNETDIATNLRIAFNGNATGYSERALRGTGSVVASFNSTSTFNSLQYMNSATSTASTFGNGEFYFPNYSGSNAKSYSVDSVTENNATAALATLTAGLWNNSSAITSIVLTPEGSGKLFQQYSTAYLYGIVKS
jgi:hypothetical protein